MKTRIEEDLIGKKEIDDSKYYGVQTQRALENFSITNQPINSFSSFIKAFAKIKKICALANIEQKSLSKEKGNAIISACDDIFAEKYNQEFIVDCIQGGAGTSSNMNFNEVIANIALEKLGHKKGSYEIVSPNDHVNLSQSTNDAYPSSCKVAIFYQTPFLIEELESLKDSLITKANEFKDVIKTGRTQMQDAVPMSFEQSFKSYAHQIEDAITILQNSLTFIKKLNLGATAIGTSIGAKKDFDKVAEKHLKQELDQSFSISSNLIAATQDASCFGSFSSALKIVALKLSKLSSDLILLSSGPKNGLNEIVLPKTQPGSSIMPGKINPVIPEVVNQACFEVIGSDVTVSLCIQNGQLELNAYEPVMVFNILKSLKLLANACKTLNEKAIIGLKVNKEHCDESIKLNLSLATALNAVIGYKKSSKITKRAMLENKSILELAIEETDLSKEELEKILDPKNMI